MNMNEGLVRLFDSQSSMEMSKIGLQEGVVDLYVVNELEPAHDGDEVAEGAVLVSQLTQEEVADVDKETEVEVEVTDGEEETELEVNDGEEDMASGDEEHEKQVKEKKSVATTKKNTSEKRPFVDSDYDLTDDEDEIMKSQVESWKKLVSEMETRKCDETEGGSSENLPSDSPSSGEDLVGDDRVKTRRFKPAIDLNDVKWEIGLRFTSKQDFTELIRHQGVKMGKKLRFKKNDNARCIAICKSVLHGKNRVACPWYVSIRNRTTYGYWQVARLRDKHICGGSSSNHGCANSKYLSKKYKEDIRIFPGMSIGQFIEKVHQDMRITITLGKAKRAIKHACSLIEVDLIHV
ncbi:uncharacterized protein LOC121809647 [Salvia splendens]|uniref:uncharacterized protein LOC121809647 n=1 Tax=Salvia splendens TaxID=180675 RepID=UPI001C27BE82|nr:uncharacterized protein LOC121809647 [Salvia splendens]